MAGVGGGNEVWLPAYSPSPQNSPFLPSTGRSLLDKERRVTCEDPSKISATQVLASVKSTFRSPSQSSRGCCQLSSAPGKSHLGQGHEENTGREDRGQPDLEEGQESGQDWTREDKTYWAKKRKFTDHPENVYSKFQHIFLDHFGLCPLGTISLVNALWNKCQVMVKYK